MVAQMSDAARAQCYALRHPPKGVQRLTYPQIRKLVRKKDGGLPEVGSIREAVKTFNKKGKKKVGRPAGWRKTTKEEDKKILQTFKKVRPPGHGVTSRKVRNALPKKLKRKVTRRTVRRRLAEKGFKPMLKLSKLDHSEKNKKKRLAFCKSHESKTVADWRHAVQAVADFRDFTYYPKDLKPRHKQLRAPWTYMSEKERMKPEFLRPKRWFKKKDWSKTRKLKIWGMTTSNGKLQAVKCDAPFNAVKFATLVRTKIGPFLKRAFPRRSEYQILVDGERLMHAPEAKAALAEWNIKALPRWPAYSPDLNPQEHIWPWSEAKVRELEKDNDTFDDFGDKVLEAIKKYPSVDNLYSSMPKRMRLCIEEKGGAIRM